MELSEFLSSAFADIAQWLEDIVTWLFNLVRSMLLTIYTMLQDLFLWVFDQVLGLVVSLLGAIDLGALGNYVLSTFLSDVGADMLNIMGLIRLPECLSIIVSAILVRIVLQLIPFVRLGS